MSPECINQEVELESTGVNLLLSQKIGCSIYINYT